MRAIAIAAKRAIPPDHAAEISAPVVRRLFGGFPDAAEAHHLVVYREEWALFRPLLGPGDVLPFALGQESVIAAGYELRAVLQRDTVGGLDRRPVRQHLGDRITAVEPVANRPVDRIADADVGHRF